MQKAMFFSALLALCFISCKNDPKTTDQTATTPAANATGTTSVGHAKPENLEGFWMNSDFITRVRANGSVIKATTASHLPYALMLNFDAKNPGVVTVSNGIEAKALKAIYKKDTIELQNAVDAKSVFLVYDSEGGGKQITMFDGTGTRTEMDVFVKSNSDLTEGNSIFANSLNFSLFDGNWSLAGKPVKFEPRGGLKGVPGFDGYQICVRGACFVLGPQMDVINMVNTEKNQAELFGWQMSTQNDTLSLYQLKAPAMKDSVYTVVNKAYTFVRGANAPAKK